MGTTVNRAYPYPGTTLAPDGPFSFQALAEAIDADVTAIDAVVDGIAAKTIPNGTQGGICTVTVTNATAQGSVNVTFPVAFSGAPSAVVLTKASTAGSASSQRKLQTVVNGLTATGFVAHLETADGANVGATFNVPCYWVAIKN